MSTVGIKEVIRRLEKLERAVFGTGIKIVPIRKKTPLKIGGTAFSLNERAFVKRFAGNKSGPKKFALVLAYLAKGDTGKNIERKNIQALWSKMSANKLLGRFNGYYANEAKNQGLVNSNKRGFYNLTDEWQNALES